MFQSQLNISNSSWDQRVSLSLTLDPPLLSLCLSCCLKVGRRPSTPLPALFKLGSLDGFLQPCLKLPSGRMGAVYFLGASVYPSASLEHMCLWLSVTQSVLRVHSDVFLWQVCCIFTECHPTTILYSLITSVIRFGYYLVVRCSLQLITPIP